MSTHRVWFALTYQSVFHITWNMMDLLELALPRSPPYASLQWVVPAAQAALRRRLCLRLAAVIKFDQEDGVED